MKQVNSITSLKKPSSLWAITIPIITAIILVALSLSGCVTTKSVHATNHQPHITFNGKGVPSHYQIKSGDTLSKIAQNYGMDYRKLGRLNNLDKAYKIKSGQWLTLWTQPTKKPHTVANNNHNDKVSSYHPKKNIQYTSNDTKHVDYNSYYYPSNNAIRRYFGSGSDGLWFSGREGDPVYAAQGGTVTYTGRGLPEFGNLIMILHADNLVTAYAHNNKIWVPEGSFVRRGQKIADMGMTGDTNQVGLQFQIRHNGTPINPSQILGSR